jgi:hypothetical protein
MNRIIFLFLIAFVFSPIASTAQSTNDSCKTGMDLYDFAITELIKLEPDSDIKEVETMLEKCSTLFQDALPYLEQCFHFDPNNEKVTEALINTYVVLNLEEQMVNDYYNKLMEQFNDIATPGTDKPGAIQIPNDGTR